MGVNTQTSHTPNPYNATLFWLFGTVVLSDYLHRSHCGQSVSSSSPGMNLQSWVQGGPCRQPQSCCLEVTSSPPLWLWCPPCTETQMEKIDQQHDETASVSMFYHFVLVLHQMMQL